MPFLTEVHFQNYRSFLDAKCRLSPVTVVIGANNAGKSNFLRGVGTAAWASGHQQNDKDFRDEIATWCHRNTNHQAEVTCISLAATTGRFKILYPERGRVGFDGQGLAISKVRWYRLDEALIGGPEKQPDKDGITPEGVGISAMLRSLWLQKDPSLRRIEKEIREMIPEISELVLAGTDSESVFVQEVGMLNPCDISELSSGSRAMLGLLTIIHQPTPPELILIEDLERDIHPRGLKPMIETIRRISKEHGVQFIFTTQHPYVLDSFQKPEFWDHVVIVEKHDGVSTLVNAKDRLETLGYAKEAHIVPLGDLWYSGLLGGVAGPNELWDEEAPKPSPP